jgi:hypothetical protein
MEIFYEIYYVKFNLDKRKRKLPKPVQQSATIQTDEIPTISAATETNDESSVSN